MWETQNSSGEAKMESAQVTNLKGRSEIQEEVTDDDVFKELINIVMDVFSTKSEKCMLTFELPVESGILKEVPRGELTSSASSSASKPDISIPLKSKRSKKSRSKRKLRLVKSRTSKYKGKKKFNGRLYPIVQTALYPKPGCTDLEKLWMQPKENHCEEIENQTENPRCVSDGWKDIAENGAPLNTSSTYLNHRIGQPQITSAVDEFSHLHRECIDILKALQELCRSQYWTPTKISFGELSYHLEEIQCHIGSIKSLLQETQPLESVDTAHLSESSEAPKVKNKVGIKLIRIGAKTGRKPSRQRTPISNMMSRHKRFQEKLTTQDTGLEEILKNYQRVKKEETKIVRNLLGKLGFQNPKCRNHSPRNPKHGMPDGADKQAPQIQTCKNKEETHGGEVVLQSIEGSLNEDTNTKAIDAVLNHVISNRKPKLVKKPQINKTESQQRFRGNHKDKKNRKHREQSKKSIEKTRKRSRDQKNIMKANKNYSLIKLFERSSAFGMNNHEHNKGNFSKRQHFIDEKAVSGIESKETVMMRRIQSAAKRLEYMHCRVEKKLNRMRKQQKELSRMMVVKSAGDGTPRESQSYDSSHTDVYDPKEKVSGFPELEQLIYKPYRNTEIEPKSLKETSTCHTYLRHCSGTHMSGDKMESKGRELEGNANKELFIRESNQNYICNYMIEIGGDEPALEPYRCTEQVSNSDKGDVCPSTVLINEFQDNSGATGQGNETGESPPSLITKGNDGEIIEESLFATPHHTNGNSRKPNPQKKKKRVIYTPSCALS